MVKVAELADMTVFIPTSERGGRGLIEPPHVHVCEGKRPHENASKFWLDPVKLEHNKNRLSASQLRKAEEYICLERRKLIAEWHRIHG